jgi:hypothetical protein
LYRHPSCSQCRLKSLDCVHSCSDSLLPLRYSVDYYFSQFVFATYLNEFLTLSASQIVSPLLRALPTHKYRLILSGP